jgi:hypothetical protein
MNTFRLVTRSGSSSRNNRGVKRWILYLAIAAAAQAGSQTHDFRNADWGMTSEQVIASEGVQPAATIPTGDQVAIRFDAPSSADLSGSLFYIFSANRLVRAQYVSTAQHTELNDYIADFANLEPTLTRKYDERLSDRAIWTSDEYQLERLPYLEQDRAHATDILPSDVNAGLSVAMGHLKMITERRHGRTRIVHALMGAQSHITHQLEYQPAPH